MASSALDSSDRRRSGRWVGCLIAAALAPTVLVVITVVVCYLSIVLHPEFDGSRKLQGSYELLLLKGYPRAIVDGQPDSRGQVRVPSEVLNPRFEVGEYAEVNRYVVGHLDPIDGRSAPGFFVIDTLTDTAQEFATQAAWNAELTRRGIDPGGLKLRW